ncbi:MAG: SpoVA/SpoVAEb family sporulation membrane protein [Clostridia bacterium]|nr:SpoVA/SpoVAEb family sporulation membrane protein [Clostridia bacterium]MDD4685674.1 SpoVA/SpoVAEb family sporulation membrane protein [Clostridia bacterium]
MDVKTRNEKYNQYVEAKMPKTKNWPSLFNSFWVGGLICIIGQGINDSILLLFPTMAEQSAWAYTLVILIFIASFLTGIGIYDRIGQFAGGGTIVPITGFSNSMTSPALDFKNEGIIFGMCVKMFSITGPVIVIGIVASTIIGLIYLLI